MAEIVTIGKVTLNLDGAYDASCDYVAGLIRGHAKALGWDTDDPRLVELIGVVAADLAYDLADLERPEGSDVDP